MPGFFNPEDYIDVQERIHKFWMENPEGRIFTELISPPADFERVAVRASVYLHRDHSYPAATGMANEWKGGGMAQAAAWLETCETSAIGRAFANMGYAVKNSNRPSKQEMEKVQRHTGENQNPQPNPTPIQRQQPQQQAPRQQQGGDEQWTNRYPPSERQINLVNKLINEKGLEGDEINERARAASNGHANTIYEMSGKDASKFIDALMNGTPSAPPSSGYANSSRQEANQSRGNMQDEATANQKGLISKLWLERGGSDEPGSKHTYVRDVMGIEWEDMTKQDATEFIGKLKDPEFVPF